MSMAIKANKKASEDAFLLSGDEITRQHLLDY